MYTAEHVKPLLSEAMSEKIENPNRALDQVLVESAQKGDKKAFGLLVEKYHRKLGRILTRMVRDQTEIEDIVQETFIKHTELCPILGVTALFIRGFIGLALILQKII
jgi:RNA polymerase sigma-70 factor (ECF subfamily)